MKNKKTLPFWICLLTSIGLSVGGFFVPPLGVIDGSVITTVGLLFGFAALAQIPVIVESVNTARFSKGDMTIEVSKKGVCPTNEELEEILD